MNKSILLPSQYSSSPIIELTNYISGFPRIDTTISTDKKYYLYIIDKKCLAYLQVLYFLQIHGISNISIKNESNLDSRFSNFSELYPSIDVFLSKYSSNPTNILQIDFELLKKIHNNFEIGYFRFPFIYKKIDQIHDQHTVFLSKGLGLGIKIDEIHDEYKRVSLSTVKYYENSVNNHLQYQQRSDAHKDYTLQFLSDQYINNYNKKIRLHTNADKILRILTLNVHSFKNNTRSAYLGNKKWYNQLYKYTHKYNYYPIKNIIVTHNPDIICLQEYVYYNQFKKTDRLLEKNQASLHDYLKQYYIIYSVSNITTLQNIICIKKIHHPTSYVRNVNGSRYRYTKYRHTITKISSNPRDKRYALTVTVLYNSKSFKITCTHLSIETRMSRMENWNKLLRDHASRSMTNHLIIGDFNDYRFYDYNTEARNALLQDRSSKFRGISLKNNEMNDFFSLIKIIEDDKYTDAFVKYATIHGIPKDEQWKKIPANTSYHGGRVDYMFFNNMWDDNALPISGVYKVYDNSSDHCPLILDLYVG